MTKKITKQQQDVLTTAHHGYSRKLNLYAFFRVHNQATSDDLVQDTFLKTWRYLIKGGKIELMKAFLYHIINNLIVDEYRKHKTSSLDSLIEKGFEPSVDSSERFFNTLDGKEALVLISRLPEKYQKVMHLRYVKDLSIKEIALITGQSKNAVTVQVHRGLKKLKILYKK